MRTRLALVAVLLTGLSVFPTALARANERDVRTVCTWGGTPAAPTGTFHLSPGITNTPSAGPLKFVATGDLAGGSDCTGKLTFDGEMKTGSSCIAQEFEGRVTGLPGIVRFWGRGDAGAVHEFMYDKAGNVVGADQPQAFTPENIPHLTDDCNSPQGLTYMTFSAVVELFGER